MSSYFVFPAITYDKQGKVFCNYFTVFVSSPELMAVTILLDIHACMCVKILDMYARECHYRDCRVCLIVSVCVCVCIFMYTIPSALKW